MATYTPNYNLYKPAGTDQFDNFLTEFGNNMDTIDANLGGGGGSSTLAGLSDVNITSPVTNDALIYDGAEWANSPLSAVAFSGDYSDLLNAPTIPTKTSDLNNDSDFVSDASYVHTDNNFTNADVTKLSGIQAGAEVNVQSDWNEADNTADDYIKNKPTIPTKTSDLNNDSGFLDSSDITVTQVQTTGTKIATIDVDGNSTDIYAPNGGGGSKHTILNESGTALADEPNLQFTDGLKASDDSGNNKTKVAVNTAFTEASTRANIASGESFSTILGKIKKFFTDLKTVAFSGSYNDLSDKPTIPTVNNATLKIQKNGTDVAAFTANASTNQTANITVPTKTSDLANDSGFVTSTDLSAKLDKNGGDIFTCDSGPSSGGYKYCQVCTITTVGTYRDGATRFEFTKRGSYVPFHVDIYCNGGNTDDPTYRVYVDQADITAYMVKTATRTWKLLVFFNTNGSAAHFISISLHRVYYTSNFKKNATVTIEGTPLTTFPTPSLLEVASELSPDYHQIQFLQGSNVTPIQAIATSDATIDLDTQCARANSVNLNNFPQKNKAIWYEVTPNCSNLPDSYWYYCLTIQGNDTGYASQFLLGMTISRVWYRRKDGGTWQAWILIK